MDQDQEQQHKWYGRQCIVCGLWRNWGGKGRYHIQDTDGFTWDCPPCISPLTDSERYAELRKLVDEWQVRREDAQRLADYGEPQLALMDAATKLATWRHR